MKKLIFTHLLLNLYLLALVQPALPLVDYVVNYDYIVAELCVNKTNNIKGCNGKCYLGKQIKQHTDSENKQNNLPKLPKIDVSSYPIFVLFESTLKNFTLSIFQVKHNFKIPNSLIESYLVSIFHPPQ